MSKKGNEWKPYIKVIDHDHITGKYLEAAHNECNLRRTIYIPIYFHNLSRYDSHLMLNVINKFGTGSLKVIPHTEEEYISFSKTYKIGNRDYELRFLDSYRLMPESLDELSSNLLALALALDSIISIICLNSTHQKNKRLYFGMKILISIKLKQ